MAKTYEEKQAAKYEQFLATLTENSEIFGLLGCGYPHSFYKVYVRVDPTAKWWLVESGYAEPARHDPIQMVANLPVEKRTGVVWAPIGYLRVFDHIAGSALARLVERVTELLGECNQHLTVTDGPCPARFKMAGLL